MLTLEHNKYKHTCIETVSSSVYNIICLLEYNYNNKRIYILMNKKNYSTHVKTTY